MLQKIIHTLHAHPDGIHTAELARTLNIEQSALEGMLETLIRQGRLAVDPLECTSCSEIQKYGTNHGSCTQTAACPWVMGKQQLTQRVRVV